MKLVTIFAAFILLAVRTKVETRVSQSARQVGIPNNPIGFLQQRVPCECERGVCRCCMPRVIGMRGCVELAYIPQDFSFDLRMKMNDRVLINRKVSGKNPPPVCFTPPRFDFGEACVTFHEIYFFGRNMHVCMDFEMNFGDFELLNRSFDCLQIGDKGVKIVKPGEGTPINVADLDIDDGEIEEYDENV